MEPRPQLTRSDIRRICGDLPDWKITEILASGGDIAALEQAKAWSMGDDETTPARNLAPESPAARMLDVLLADEEQDEWEAGLGPS
jgi:hypothetical protein